MNPQPVGLSRDLAPQQVMRAAVGQHDIAVWRSTSGVVSAWENRCPHRGMRLSYGFVRGESLACAYHGWHYNCSGQCHFIPAHPELEPPKTIRPAIYRAIEHAGLIWVDTSDLAQGKEQRENQTDEQNNEDITELAFNLPTDLRPLRSLSFHCSLDALLHATSNIAQPDHTTITTLNTTESVKSQILSLCTPAVAKPIYLVLHTPLEKSVTAHILVSNSLNSNDQIQVSRWCESLRRAVEVE